MLTGCS